MKHLTQVQHIKQKACKPVDKGGGKEFTYMTGVATEFIYVYDKATGYQSVTSQEFYF